MLLSLLTLYDMLFRDNLSKADIKKLKEVAVTLLQIIIIKFLNLTIGQISKKQKHPLVILSVIPFGQNCLSVTMRIASLSVVNKFMNMYTRGIKQLLNKS